MPQNGQTHFKNLAANAARFLKRAWLFWDIEGFNKVRQRWELNWASQLQPPVSMDVLRYVKIWVNAD